MAFKVSFIIFCDLLSRKIPDRLN